MVYRKYNRRPLYRRKLVMKTFGRRRLWSKTSKPAPFSYQPKFRRVQYLRPARR